MGFRRKLISGSLRELRTTQGYMSPSVPQLTSKSMSSTKLRLPLAEETMAIRVRDCTITKTTMARSFWIPMDTMLRLFATSARKAAPSRAHRSLSPAAGCEPESTLELAGHVALIGEPCSERGLHKGCTAEHQATCEI